MSFYLGIIILCFIILGYMFFLKNVFDYNYSTSIFLSLTIIMFSMTIFCMLNILLVGFYIVTICGLFFLVFFTIKNIIQHKFKIKEFFTLPNILFFILFICIVYICRKIYLLMDWDECSYWATTVKRLYFFDSFLGGENFHTFCYPPALTSYQYFVVKLLGMQDKSIYFAQYLYIISGLIFLIRNIKLKNFFYGILTFLSSLIFLILLLKPYIFTLYSEFPIMIALSCSIYFFVTREKKSDYIFIGMILFCLALIKSNSFACSLLPIAVIAFNILNNYINNLKSKKINRKQVFNSFILTLKEKKVEFILILVPFVANYAFNLFLKINSLTNPHTLKTGVSGFLNGVIEKQDIVSSYLRALSSNYTYSNFNLSAILLITSIIIGLYILIKLHKNTSEALSANKYIGVAYFSVFIIYSVLVLYSYLFLFTKFEASLLASYERYMNVFIGGAGLAFIGFLGYFIDSNSVSITKKIRSFIIIVFLIILTVTNINDLFDIFKQILPKTQMPTRSEMILADEVTKKYSSYFTTEDHIHIISEGDYGLTVWSVMYYMCPLKTYDPRFEGSSFWSIEYPGDISQVDNSTKLTSDEYLNYLKKYNFTHVLIIQTDEVLYTQYGNIFENLPDENSVPTGIYKINYDTDKLVYVDID